MSLFEVGRLCLKVAGRDAGRKCTVVEQLDHRFVLVDGDVRRKKVNIKHLEPLESALEIKEGASHEIVKKEFEKLGWPVWEKKSKLVAERPKRQRKSLQKEPVSEEGKSDLKIDETIKEREDALKEGEEVSPPKKKVPPIKKEMKR